jgi:hypothetical protein
MLSFSILTTIKDKNPLFFNSSLKTRRMSSSSVSDRNEFRKIMLRIYPELFPLTHTKERKRTKKSTISIMTSSEFLEPVDKSIFAPSDIAFIQPSNMLVNFLDRITSLKAFITK